MVERQLPKLNVASSSLVPRSIAAHFGTPGGATRMTVMNRSARAAFRCALLAGALLVADESHAHPYDSPLEFRQHRTEDGREIYSNIPKKCFANGVLTCYRLHPIFPPARVPNPAPDAGGN